MAAPGNAYPAVQLDSRGQVVDSGVVVQFTDSTDQPGSGGGGGSLPTGWTTNDPVSGVLNANGGTLTFDTDENSEIYPGGAVFQPGGTGPSASISISAVALSVSGNTAIIIDGNNGATVALDAGGLLVVGFQGLPTSDPGVAGALYTLANALMVSTG